MRSTRAGRAAPSGRTPGSGWTSAATSPWPMPSAARSSPPGWRTSGSSATRRRASRPIGPPSSPTPSSTPSARPGCPAEAIRELAHAFAKADRAMICWTLGITEHHNAVDNVLSLISLVLLTGHVGRYGSGVNPLRGQNNVQGGGDMGALPDRLPGFQHVENDSLRAKFDAAWGVPIPPRRGWHLSGMFDAMERGELTAVYCIGENPVQSEADQKRAVHLLTGPRLPRRPGPVPDQDRGAGRCRPAGHRGLGRERGHGHQLGATGPAGPRGRRPAAGRPGRPGHHLRAGEPDGRRVGRRRSPSASGTRSARCRRSTPG